MGTSGFSLVVELSLFLYLQNHLLSLVDIFPPMGTALIHANGKEVPKTTEAGVPGLST